METLLSVFQKEGVCRRGGWGGYARFSPMLWPLAQLVVVSVQGANKVLDWELAVFSKPFPGKRFGSDIIIECENECWERERENTVVFGLFSIALLMCREVVAQNWGAGWSSGVTSWTLGSVSLNCRSIAKERTTFVYNSGSKPFDFFAYFLKLYIYRHSSWIKHICSLAVGQYLSMHVTTVRLCLSVYVAARQRYVSMYVAARPSVCK